MSSQKRMRVRHSKQRLDPGEADLATVRRVGMGLLARREHSQLELRRKLTDRELPEGLIEEALEGLASEGLQSDERYTEAFVYSRIQRGQGPMKIRQELRSRGISDELVAEHLGSQDRETWLERAERVRRQRFGAARPADWASKVKQAKFLQQRGFAMEHIRIDVEE
jgi:regulatory protein